MEWNGLLLGKGEEIHAVVLHKLCEHGDISLCLVGIAGWSLELAGVQISQIVNSARRKALILGTH